MKIKVSLCLLFAGTWIGSSVTARSEPIGGSGFSVDIIAEKEGATPDEVTDYSGLARWVYAEAGAPSLDSTTATETVPDSADRTYTTLAGTEFLLEPYDAPNALISEDTFTLATPGSFSELRFLIFGIGGNGTDNFQATVNFADGSSTLLPFSISDWQAPRDYNAAERTAITRREAGGWNSYFGPGIFPREIVFELSEDEQSKVIETIDFLLADRLAVSALSGTANTPQIPLEITDFQYDRGTNRISLTWLATTGSAYRVKYTSDLQDWSDERILGSGLGSSDDEEPEDPSRITVGFDLPERLAEPEGLDLPWFFRVESQ